MNILFESPFAVGDWVRIGDTEGVVENVTMWHTRINTSNGSVLTLLNKRIPELDVENFGAAGYRFVHFRILIAVDTDSKTAKDFVDGIRNFLLAYPLIKKDSIAAYLYDFSSWGIEILVQVYLKVSDDEQEYIEREKFILDTLALAKKHSVQLVSSSAELARKGQKKSLSSSE